MENLIYRIGEHVRMRRKQQADYNFDNYVNELDKGDTGDPKKSRIIEWPIQDMMTTSNALKMVSILHYCKITSPTLSDTLLEY